MDAQKQAEQLLDQPYWVIDPLPCRVPAEGGGQYFAVEEEWLRAPNIIALRRRFLSILLKLNCYFDVEVCRADQDVFVRNPAPWQMEAWTAETVASFLFLFSSQDSLITLYGGDTCMTVYHPSGPLLAILEKLVSAEGLFLWQAQPEKRMEERNLGEDQPE